MRLLAIVYRIILSRRVALVYFCVIYFHETYIFMRFIEQKQVYMVLQYYYILELTTIFAVDIDIQENSSPVFIGYYQVEE